MNRNVLIVLILGLVALAVGAAAAVYVSFHHDPAATTAATEHHGMSPALWVAIFAGVWVPLLAGASRRRRDKKAAQDKQP